MLRPKHIVVYYILLLILILLCSWLYVYIDIYTLLLCIIDLTQRGWHTLRLLDSNLTIVLFVVVYTVCFRDLEYQSYIYVFYTEQSALYSRFYSTMYSTTYQAATVMTNFTQYFIQGIHKRVVRFQKLTRNLFLTLHGHNVHRQQRQLSKFLMRYQQFASHAYCGAAGPVFKMASQQEKAFCVLRFEVYRSV